MQKAPSVFSSQLLNLVMSFPVFARPGTVWSRSEKLMAAFFSLLICRTFLTISKQSGNLASLELTLRTARRIKYLAYPPHNHQTFDLVMSCPVSARTGTAVLGGSTTHGHFFFEVSHMQENISCSCSTPVVVSSLNPHSKAYYWAMSRKVRLIEASNRLAFLLETLEPSKGDDKGKLFIHFSDDALLGLKSILGCVRFALAENKDAFCSCYEEQQGRDTGEGLPISIHNGAIITADELMALAEKNSTGPGEPVEEWADELPGMLQFILELIISEFDCEKNSQSNIATACRCLAAMCCGEDGHVRNS